MHMSPRTFTSLALLLLLTACAASPGPLPEWRPEPGETPYRLEIAPRSRPLATDDGFDLRLDFTVTSPEPLDQDSLVQELFQTTTRVDARGRETTSRFTLVEAFRIVHAGRDGQGHHVYRLAPGQLDHHYLRGLRHSAAGARALRIERLVFAYLARIEGADFTPLGFAHLPANESGNVTSAVSASFNANYQRRHATKGLVRKTNHAGAVLYRLEYERGAGRPARFSFTRTSLQQSPQPVMLLR
jgi:hypothetical protein